MGDGMERDEGERRGGAAGPGDGQRVCHPV
jgi:hypothetical protein